MFEIRPIARPIEPPKEVPPVALIHAHQVRAAALAVTMLKMRCGAGLAGSHDVDAVSSGTAL